MEGIRLLTPVQVAQYLQVKPETVQGWLRDGTLRGIKVGRFWRVPEESIRSVLKPNDF